MNKKPLIIGVAGGTGSGKSRLVRQIADCISNQNIMIINHDSYYKDRSHLPHSEREKINYDHPNALDTNLLVQHLEELTEGKKVELPLYNFSTHTRKKNGKHVGPAKVVIVEGILIFNDHKLRELLDIKIFMDTANDIRFIRRLQRDIKKRNRNVSSIIKQYIETVRPMHIEFVEPTKKFADIVIPGDYTPIAIDIIISMINNKNIVRRAKNKSWKDKKL